MSGRIWEKQGQRVYFLQRWPSRRSLKRVRQRVKERTGRERNGVKDVRVLIAELNPTLRGWGNCFRTGNAAQKLNQVATCVRVTRNSGTATSSGASGCTVCAAPSSTRRQRNAVA
jgi:hypothetical protein